MNTWTWAYRMLPDGWWWACTVTQAVDARTCEKPKYEVKHCTFADLLGTEAEP